MKGNLKVDEKIYKKQKPSRGGGGAAPKASTGNKPESQKENAARLALWQSECIALNKLPPTPGGTSIITFTKSNTPGLALRESLYIGVSITSCGACTPLISANLGTNRPLTGRITRNLPAAAAQVNRPWLP